MEIDINNEEEILKKCDFDYYYNSLCGRELCMFYNDISKLNKFLDKFDIRQAYIDLGRIAITLNKLFEEIEEYKIQLAEKDILVKKIKKLNNKIHDLEFEKRNIDKLISDLPTVVDLCISECLSLKLSLRDRVCFMENSEHCFPQNAVLWSDIVSIIDKRVKDLKS